MIHGPICFYYLQYITAADGTVILSDDNISTTIKEIRW